MVLSLTTANVVSLHEILRKLVVFILTSAGRAFEKGRDERCAFPRGQSIRFECVVSSLTIYALNSIALATSQGRSSTRHHKVHAINLESGV